MVFLYSMFHILLVAAIAWNVYKASGHLKKVLWPALLLKIAAGVALGLVYKYYYAHGDTFSFFADATQMTSLARRDTVEYLKFLFQDNSTETVLTGISHEPRSLFFVKIVSVVALCTGDNYWIASMYFSFVSFLAAWWLIKILTHLIPSVSRAAVVAFLFFPSVVFWSSGILKESVAFAALCILAGVFVAVWKRQRLTFLAYTVTVMATFVLWHVKYYYLGVFLPMVLCCLLVRLLFRASFLKQSLAAEVLAFSLLAVVSVVVITFAHPNFSMHRIFEVVVENYRAYENISSPGNMIHYDQLEPTLKSMAAHAPWALFSGLFRPFVFEADTLFKWWVGIENLVLFFLCFSALYYVRRGQGADRVLAMGVVFYVVILCVFLSLSAPNLGTLSRYKVGFLPFFVLLVVQPLLGGRPQVGTVVKK